MCWECGILRRILSSFRKKISGPAGEKAADLQPFFRVVLEKALFCCGVFVVRLW